MRIPAITVRLGRWSGREDCVPTAELADADAFRTLVLPHIDAAYSLARYLVRDRSLSEEVVQDAFERALKAFRGYRGGSPRAWLLAIVRNCCYTANASARRSRMRILSSEWLPLEELATIESDPDEAENPENRLIRNQEIEQVRGAINRLPEPFRETLVLREIEEMSYKEIAEVTGVALGTVMSRLSRARSILSETLLESGIEDQVHLAFR